MRKVIEYTLLSADGVSESPQRWGALGFRDDAYLRDGLGLLLASDAMLMGRNFYESAAKIWPSRNDPWAVRLNAMQKYVFSSTLKSDGWNNTTIIPGDAVAEVTKLRQQDGSNLLIWGHTLLAEDLIKHQLVDILDLSIHPVLVGHGTQFLREGLSANLKLTSVKAFTKIVKITYELQN